MLGFKFTVSLLDNLDRLLLLLNIADVASHGEGMVAAGSPFVRVQIQGPDCLNSGGNCHKFSEDFVEIF